MTSVSLYKIKLNEIITFIILNLFANANRFECKFNLYKYYKNIVLLHAMHQFSNENFLRSLMKRI